MKCTTRCKKELITGKNTMITEKINRSAFATELLERTACFMALNGIQQIDYDDVLMIVERTEKYFDNEYNNNLRKERVIDKEEIDKLFSGVVRK